MGKWGFFACRGGSATIAAGVCCFIPFALIWTLSYQDRIESNNRLIETTCNIVDHDIETMICTESCNCRTFCTGSRNGNCHTSCDTCEYTCYDGLIGVEYIIKTGEEVFSQIQVANNRRTIESAQNRLNDFPIGSTVQCLYDRENPENVRLEPHKPTIFLAFGIIFIIFGSSIILGWIIFEAQYYFRHKEIFGTDFVHPSSYS